MQTDTKRQGADSDKAGGQRLQDAWNRSSADWCGRIPAIQEAKKLGIKVEGPESPDTVFVKCKAGMYDIVVAMYHDQGHIPLKLNAFQWDEEKGQYKSVRGINCTIGLPIVRASVDHGTAFGKAGEGRANADSMLDAIEAGLRMAEKQVG